MTMGGERRIRDLYSHGVLLTALVLVAFVRPLFGDAAPGVSLLDSAFLVLLVTGATISRESEFPLAPVHAAAVVTLGAQVVLEFSQWEPVIFVFIGGYITLLGAVAARIGGTLFSTRRHVTTDVLCGAISVYLILGIVWALAFVALEMLAPGSFHFAAGTPARSDVFWRFLGFSFATLTTLGYGNVAPATRQGDAIATAEAVVGQMYVAIVIARIVALQIAAGGDQDTARPESDEPSA